MLKLAQTPETQPEQPEQPDGDAVEAILERVAADGAELEDRDINTALAIVEHLRERESFGEADVMQRFGLADGHGRRMVWEAKEIARDAHAIEFVPGGESPGHYVRATDEQCLRRIRSFRRAVRGKMARMVAIGEARASVTKDSDMRRRLESAAAKAGDEALALEATARAARKPRPDGI